MTQEEHILNLWSRRNRLEWDIEAFEEEIERSWKDWSMPVAYTEKLQEAVAPLIEEYNAITEELYSLGELEEIDWEKEEAEEEAFYAAYEAALKAKE